MADAFAFNLTNGPVSPPLALLLRRESDGPVLSRTPVAPGDFADVLSECWRELYLRRGRPLTPFSSMSLELQPVRKQSAGRLICSGFTLLATDAADGAHRVEFTNFSLRGAAQRAATGLVDRGILQSGQPYFYELAFHPRPGFDAGTGQEKTSFQVSIKSPALTFRTLPLQPLLHQATPVKAVDATWFPVFYTASALAKAERLARKGSAAESPVETGAILLGHLGSCPESGELFAVVRDALEVLEADEKTFSLAYTSRSWTRLQTVVKARQQQDPALRILGQCHGHNFLPNDGKTCEACLTRAECSLHNVFVSLEDQTWTRAVFAHQPWQLCHIFGLAARGVRVNGLFGLQDGRLLERGYFVLPDDPKDGTGKP